MGEAPVDWTPALFVLALGVLAGLVIAVRARASREAAATLAVPLEVRDLMGKRDVLIHQLQELQDMAGKKTAGELDEERYALELEAARVLMELDERTTAVKAKPRAKAEEGRKEPAAAPGFLAARPALRGFLWGAGAMMGLGGLLLSVRETAAPRQEGGSLTGETPMQGRPPMAAAAEPQSEEEAQIRAAIERNPDDLDARMALVQASLGRQDMMGVWNETKAILDRSPGHPRAIAYQALVRLAMGQGDVARTMLEKVIAANPDVLEGYLHLTLVHMRSGREADAEAVMARAAKRFPARAAMLKDLMAEMKRQAAADGPAPEAGEADPHAGLAAGEPQPAGEAPLPAPGGKSVAGTVDIDSSLKGSLAPGGLVFITARAEGQTSGPPAAVKRLPAAFPLRFQLSASDSMLGGELPDRLRIEARVDSDGDPLTRDPADPSARADSVATGTQDLKLVLRR